MPIRSKVPNEIPEKSAFRYAATLTKEDGIGIAATDLVTLTLTLYNLDAAFTIINAVNAVSILNVGRGTIDANGNLVVVLDSADLALVDATQERERHIMLIQGVYAGGARATRHEVQHTVVNLEKVS